MMRMKGRRRGGRGVTSAMTPGVGSQLADIIPHAGSVGRQENRRRGGSHGVGVSWLRNTTNATSTSQIAMKDRRHGSQPRGVGVSVAFQEYVEAPSQGVSATSGTPASYETEMSAVTLARRMGVAWTGLGKAAQRNSWIREPAEGRTPASGWSVLAQEQRARVWQQPSDTGISKPSRNPRPVTRQFLPQRQETR